MQCPAYTVKNTEYNQINKIKKIVYIAQGVIWGLLGASWGVTE